MSTSTLRRISMEKVSRRRAARACLKCRKRKVRCDVTRTSQPCSNCRYNADECVVASRVFNPALGEFTSEQHKRVDHSPSLELLAASLTSSTPPIEATSIRDAISPVSPTAEEPPSNGQQDADFFYNASIHSNDISAQLSYDMPRTGNDSRASLETNRDEEVPKAPSETTVPLSISVSSTSCWDEIGPTERPPHHDFTLDSQGCYKIPSKQFLEIFIRHYFLYVHPMLPLLDEGEFWDLYFLKTQARSQSHHPSILLLQAMLFATCPFVAEDHIKRLGFKDIRQAKEMFYRRAKFLYHAQDPLDHILMAQGALLLTYRCSSLGYGEQKVNSIWLGRAIQHVKIFKSDECISASLQHDNTFRRLWLSCILRDRVLALSLHRKVQISPAYLSHHTSFTMSYDDFSDEIQRSRVYDADSKGSLITIMLLMTELCLCLSDTLTVAYSVREPTRSESHGSSRKMIQIWECKKDLETWFVKAVSSSSVLASTQPGCLQCDRPKDSISMFAHLVWVYYYSSRITLCNSELLLDATSCAFFPCGSAQLPSTTIKRIRMELWDAATDISQRLGQLLNLGLARYLPGSAVSCAALPLALHVLDARLSAGSHCASTEKRVERQDGLNTLIDAMREYRPRHEETDYITKAIRYFMECTYLEATSPSRESVNGKNPELEDVLAHNPTQYLKLALTLDLSLSQDRLPVEKDFPPQIQGLISRTGCFMPIVFSHGGQCGDHLEPPSAELGQGKILWESPQASDLAGWIQNDRSLFFAQEMGLGP